MNSHRAHREHRGYNDFSVFSVPSVASSLHTFEAGLQTYIQRWNYKAKTSSQAKQLKSAERLFRRSPRLRANQSSRLSKARRLIRSIRRWRRPNRRFTNIAGSLRSDAQPFLKRSQTKSSRSATL